LPSCGKVDSDCITLLSFLCLPFAWIDVLLFFLSLLDKWQQHLSLYSLSISLFWPQNIFLRNNWAIRVSPHVTCQLLQPLILRPNIISQFIIILGVGVRIWLVGPLLVMIKLNWSLRKSDYIYFGPAYLLQLHLLFLWLSELEVLSSIDLYNCRISLYDEYKSFVIWNFMEVKVRSSCLQSRQHIGHLLENRSGFVLRNCLMLVFGSRMSGFVWS
jgi:hypothetical protein